MQPGIVEPQRSGPFGKTPARAITRNFRIALSADQDAGLPGRKVEAFCSFASRCEEHRLLTKRLLKIFRWKTQAGKIELHGLGGRALPFTDQASAAEERIAKIGSRTAIADPRTHGHDRNV